LKLRVFSALEYLAANAPSRRRAGHGNGSQHDRAKVQGHPQRRKEAQRRTSFLASQGAKGSTIF
jgi:hypothetical protein